MIAPSTNPISMRFGATEYPYSPPEPHMGLDFLPNPDRTIYAPFDGIVTQIPNNGRDGNGIYMVDPKSGDFHGLLHTEKYLTANNTRIKEGQPIGIMGFSGFVVPTGERGRHLHWCVKRKAKFIDPMILIKGDNNMTDGDAITEADIDILRILYACLEGGDYEDTLGKHANDSMLLKNLKGAPLRTAIRNMFQNPNSQQHQAKIQRLLGKGGPSPLSAATIEVKINGVDWAPKG